LAQFTNRLEISIDVCQLLQHLTMLLHPLTILNLGIISNLDILAMVSNPI
jgi:hypothetical protein